MYSDTLISADSHIYEPQDLWTTRVEKKFRDLLRIERDDSGGEFLVAGNQAFPVFRNMLNRLGSTNRSKDNPKRLSTWSDEDLERLGQDGAWNPSSTRSWEGEKRVEDQDLDGVSAEVLYPSWTPFFYFLENADLQAACLRAYDTWMAENCSYDPRRLHGIAVVGLTDIAGAVKELERCKAIGLKGVLIPSFSPPDLPYSSPAYDPFWRAAASLEMPVSLHCQINPHDLRPKRQTTVYMAMLHDEVAWSIGEIVMGGALERVPDLKLVSVENEIHWMPAFVRRLDRYFRKFKDETLSAPPSESFRRVYGTFIDEPIGPDACQLFDGANYMWGNDFPHSDSSWPHSRKVIERDFADVSPEVTRKIVCENVVELYGLTLN